MDNNSYQGSRENISKGRALRIEKGNLRTPKRILKLFASHPKVLDLLYKIKSFKKLPYCCLLPISPITLERSSYQARHSFIK